jgi:hypothetical protein
MAIGHTLASLGPNDSTGGFCCEQVDYITSQGRRQAWGRDDCVCTSVEARQEHALGRGARRPALRRLPGITRKSPSGRIPGKQSSAVA